MHAIFYRRRAISTQPDLVIRSGNVVDGLGGEPQRADVAINNGKITEVGKIGTKGRSEFNAGAHVTYVMDAGWATFVLVYWIREKGLFSMGEGIRQLTSAPARVLGLSDRGALKPGNWADINIFDAAKVAEGYPHRVHDFPGGAPRLTQPSIGYKATLVNGQFNVIDGRSTDTHAGMVLRHIS